MILGPAPNIITKLVTALAYAGTLPMFACVFWINENWSLPLFKAYSMAILAFLTGAWWAFALMNQRKLSQLNISLTLILSNLVVLSAVACFVLANEETLLMFSFLFGCLLVGERNLGVFLQQPNYYKKLRLVVTSITISLQLTAYGLTR